MSNQRSRIVVISAGFVYSLAGILMMIFPGWFFEHIGHFEPFNPHYIRDTAAFTLPLGAGLIWAGITENGIQLMLFIGVAASLLHFISHLIDAVGEAFSHWLFDVVPLMLLAGLLLIMVIMGKESAEELTDL